MKVIINIPEDVYKYINSLPCHTMLEEYVVEGTLIPQNATRKEVHSIIFGIDPPELDSPYCACATSKDGCNECSHKEDLNCDVNWWNAPYNVESEEV